jgi:RHS repeat-associated protein
LGNVLSVVSDKKLFVSDHWESYVLSAQDYYPFGMSMPGRKHNGGTYRYGFNGKETDSETGLNDFGARFYAPNIGRWLSVDPKPRSYVSNYISFNNSPLWYADPDGRADIYATDGTKLGSDGNKGDGKIWVITDSKEVERLRAFENKEAMNPAASSYFELPPYEHRQQIKKQIEDIPRVEASLIDVWIDTYSKKTQVAKTGKTVKYAKYEVGGVGIEEEKNNNVTFEYVPAEDPVIDERVLQTSLHVAPEIPKDKNRTIDIKKIKYTWHYHPLAYAACVSVKGQKEPVSVFLDHINLSTDKIVGIAKLGQYPTDIGGDLEWARVRIPHVKNNFMISEAGYVDFFNKDTKSSYDFSGEIVPPKPTNSSGRVTQDFFFNVQEGQKYEKK